MARRAVPRSSAPRGPVLRSCSVAVAVGLLAGCSGGPDTPPATTTTVAPTAATTSSTATVSPTTSGPTTSAPTFDCTAVGAAQRALDEAYADELERLDVHRGDPRAQSVYALVTTTQGPAYYSAVLAAAPTGERTDAQLVLDYYERLSARVGDLEVDSGSAPALAAAMDRLDEATLALDPSPAATGGAGVVAAQERLQAGVPRSCTGASAPPATSSSPAGATATATTS